MNEKEFYNLTNVEKMRTMKQYSFMKNWWYNRICKTCKFQNLNGEPSTSKKCKKCKEDNYEEITEQELNELRNEGITRIKNLHETRSIKMKLLKF